jgi:hypothetical protein
MYFSIVRRTHLISEFGRTSAFSGILPGQARKKFICAVKLANLDYHGKK